MLQDQHSTTDCKWHMSCLYVTLHCAYVTIQSAGGKDRRVVFSSGLHLITWAQIPQSSQKPLDLPLMKYWATINATKSDGTTSKTLCPSPVLPPLALPLSPLGPPGRGTCPYTARELGSGPCSSAAVLHAAQARGGTAGTEQRWVSLCRLSGETRLSQQQTSLQPSSHRQKASWQVVKLLHTHYCQGHPIQLTTGVKSWVWQAGLLVVPVKHQCQLWVKTVLVDLLRVLQAGVYELLRSLTSLLRLLSTQDCYKDPYLYIRNHGIQDF